MCGSCDLTQILIHRWNCSFFGLATRLFDRTVVNHGTRVRYSGVTCPVQRGHGRINIRYIHVLQYLSIIIPGSTLYYSYTYFLPLEDVNKMYIFRYIYTYGLILFNYVFSSFELSSHSPLYLGSEQYLHSKIVDV